VGEAGLAASVGSCATGSWLKRSRRPSDLRTAARLPASGPSAKSPRSCCRGWSAPAGGADRRSRQVGLASSNHAGSASRDGARRCQWRTAGPFCSHLAVCAQPAAWQVRRRALIELQNQHCATANRSPPVGRPLPSGKGNDKPQQVGWGRARLNLTGQPRRRED